MSRQEKPSILPPAPPQLVQSLGQGKLQPSQGGGGQLEALLALCAAPFTGQVEAGGCLGLFPPTCLQCGLSAGATETLGLGEFDRQGGGGCVPKM